MMNAYNKKILKLIIKLNDGNKGTEGVRGNDG
jgi:hypothetical protein